MAKLTTYSVNASVPMKIHACAECGIYFGMTNGFEEIRIQDGGSFFCPAGHEQSFEATEEQERQDEKKFSVTDYANNAVLQSQVEYLSQRLRKAERALRATAKKTRAQKAA